MPKFKAPKHGIPLAILVTINSKLLLTHFYYYYYDDDDDDDDDDDEKKHWVKDGAFLL